VQGPALYERVATLERELADVKNRIEAKSRGVEGGAYSQLLAYTRHKLGLELSNPLFGSGPSMSKYRDAHSVVQEVTTVDVDCCLAEFEAIWATVSSMTAEGVDVVPREPDEGSSRIIRVYSIRFQHFSGQGQKWGRERKRRSVFVYLAAFYMETRRRVVRWCWWLWVAQV
jgi:hypothetical protein